MYVLCICVQNAYVEVEVSLHDTAQTGPTGSNSSSISSNRGICNLSNNTQQ